MPSKTTLYGAGAALGAIVVAVIAWGLWGSGGSAEDGSGSLSKSEIVKVQPWDEVLGSPDAPVTIIEYASVTCSHCAHFAKELFPKLKEKYIDTGKAKLVLREYPTPPADRAAAGFLMARCLPKDRYFPMIDVLFRTQSTWAFGDDPFGELQKLAVSAGLTPKQFADCIHDQKGLERISQVQSDAHNQLGITGTPSFVIDGKFYPKILSPNDDQSWQNIQTLLDELLAEKQSGK